MFVTVPARSRHHDLIADMAGAGIPVHVVSGEVMDDLAQTVTTCTGMPASAMAAIRS